MRKLLSILMLVSLLCGMLLPAAADGEPAELWAKLGDTVEDTDVKELKV